MCPFHMLLCDLHKLPSWAFTTLQSTLVNLLQGILLPVWQPITIYQLYVEKFPTRQKQPNNHMHHMQYIWKAFTILGHGWYLIKFGMSHDKEYKKNKLHLILPMCIICKQLSITNHLLTVYITIIIHQIIYFCTPHPPHFCRI